jgi:hypothetical protein
MYREPAWSVDSGPEEVGATRAGSLELYISKPALHPSMALFSSGPRPSIVMPDFGCEGSVMTVQFLAILLLLIAYLLMPNRSVRH